MNVFIMAIKKQRKKKHKQKKGRYNKIIVACWGQLHKLSIFGDLNNNKSIK